MDVLDIHNKEIKEVVWIHKSAFKGFFLTELGDGFLSLYYKSVLNHKDGILLGCFDKYKLIGFCSGSLNCSGFNTKIIKENLLDFCLIGLKLLFTRPKALLRLRRNLEKEDSNHDDGNYAELASIGVDLNFQGKGVGGMLLNAIENYCREKGCRILTLTTDYNENDEVVKFYQRNGYKIWYDFVTYPNRRMYKLRKEL